MTAGTGGLPSGPLSSRRFGYVPCFSLGAGGELTEIFVYTDGQGLKEWVWAVRVKEVWGRSTGNGWTSGIPHASHWMSCCAGCAGQSGGDDGPFCPCRPAALSSQSGSGQPETVWHLDCIGFCVERSGWDRGEDQSPHPSDMGVGSWFVLTLGTAKEKRKRGRQVATYARPAPRTKN